MRHLFYQLSLLVVAINIAGYFYFPWILYSLIFFGPLIFMGMNDALQSRQTIKRNFPILGRFRYLLEMIRPEIQQYFIESNEDGKPFSREKRSVIYQRSKTVIDTVPFGTQNDVYEPGYEWINHSLLARPALNEEPRVLIGESTCAQPYSASLLNISAMSYGALSKNAIQALNGGAKQGGFAHNTGEGAISPYHKKNGGDLIWQLGTGYFGCRTKDGGFDKAKFAEKSQQPQVKMIEIKLSQGAKPGHGGILPGEKVNAEVSEIRGVEIGKDVISPPTHSAFSNPHEMLDFISMLRETSGGKPIGIKLCVGKRREFFSLCKMMLKSGQQPDYIAVDGSEGGTGAAPLEFSNTIGTPLNDGLIFIHNALVGTGLRDKIKIIASGKIATGFNITQKLALGADLCYAARSMMFALGCIQALRCNTNDCPTGVATQDKELVDGLEPVSKAKRVAKFHHATIHSFLEVLGAAGLDHPSELRPWHIQRRVSISQVKHYGQIYPYLKDRDLLEGNIPQSYARAWENAAEDTFAGSFPDHDHHQANASL